MKSRSLSTAWKIMMIPNFAVLLFGLVFTFIPDAINSQGYESFTGQSWSAFVSTSPKTADLLLLTAGRMFGVHILIITVLLFGITLTSFRSGERWSWYALLIGDTLFAFDIVAVLIMGLVPLAIGNVVVISLAYVGVRNFCKGHAQPKNQHKYLMYNLILANQSSFLFPDIWQKATSTPYD